jgi:hypothetical protein
MSKKADKFIDKYIVGKNDWLLKNKEVISKLLDEYEAEQLTIPVVSKSVNCDDCNGEGERWSAYYSSYVKCDCKV